MSPTTPVRVGVLGASGAVGRAAARTLAPDAPAAEAPAAEGGYLLRFGATTLERARAVVAAVAPGSEAARVDAYDPHDLASFCDGCDVVVNCAGPSYRILDRVARAASAAGAHYVDAGGDDPLLEAIERAGLSANDRAFLVTAGMMPGLTGLLPRLLAREMDRARRLTAYIGVMDRLTPAGAVDYLLSLGSGYGEAQAAWRDGARRSRALVVLQDVTLPFFPGRVTAYPYLSTESERVAADLGLRSLDWYNVFDGGARMLATLGRSQGAMAGEGDLEEAARELARAADLDLFGKQPYQLMLIELEGERAGERVVRTAMLRSDDTYELTGTVTALAARAAAAGEVAAGVGFAAERLDPVVTVERLRRTPVGRSLLVLDAAATEAEEGAL